MPFDIGAIGANAANTAIGAGMGLLLGAHNDRRQIKQQQKLQDMQVAGQKQMIDFSQQKQYEMWEKTNYGPQMEQLKKAGLNPGLLYGMGGGGGSTTGNASGNISGGNSQQNPGEAQGMGIAMMQAQLMQAQKANLEASTEKTKAETDKTKVDTQVSTANVGKTYAEGELTTQQVNMFKRTFEEQVQKIVGESESAWTKGKVDTATVNEQTQQKVDEALQVALKNANISQDTAQKVQEIAQKWKGLDLEERKTAVAELVGGQQKDQDQIISLINTIVNVAGRFIGIKRK